jgi:hypothetical protein
METYEVSMSYQPQTGTEHHLREARHPNVVLYLGLSRVPPPDGRIFIISEYIENGASCQSCLLLLFTPFLQET